MSRDEEIKPKEIKGKEDLDFFINWLRKSDLVRVNGFQYYTEIQFSEMKEKVYLSAMEEFKKKVEAMRKGAFNYQDNDGAVPSIVFSRGYNQAIDDLKKKLGQRGANEKN